MSRQLQPFHADDASALARALRKQLVEHHAAHGGAPSHSTLLHMLAHAVGHRNYQSLRAAPPPGAAGPGATPPSASPAAPPPVALPAGSDRLLRVLDDQGALSHWPSRRGVQVLALWYLWTLFEARRVYTEREVNAVLAAHNRFEDHVLLRRELVELDLLTRTADGREYRKQTPRASPEVAALLRAVRGRLAEGRARRAEASRTERAGQAAR